MWRRQISALSAPREDVQHEDHVDLYMLFGSQVIKDLNSTLLLEHPVVRFERKTSLSCEANGEHIKKDIFKI